MRPTEHEATVAVNAAALERFTAARESVPAEHRIEWSDLHPIDQNAWREAVLPTVWAALEALPDRRVDAWDEGYCRAARDEAADIEPADNPYREERPDA